MEMSCNTTIQGLVASLALSIGLLAAEQVIASSSCTKSNSLAQIVIHLLHTFHNSALASQPQQPQPPCQMPPAAQI
jgi:hypothetical protein